MSDGIDFWTVLAASFALMLVVEGVLPFCSPATWRAVFERATRCTDQQLRIFGLSSMLAGLILLIVFLR